MRGRRFINIMGSARKAISPPSFTGSGDVKSGAYAYWSTARAYNAAYATGSNPAMDLVDQAGANPITINIKTTGIVDVAAINTWVTTNSVTTIRVAKLYDQTGSGRHVSQATLANMPKLLLSHPALGNAAIPVMDFLTSSNQRLVSAATGLNSAIGTFSVIARQDHKATGTFGGIVQASAFGVAYSQPNQGFSALIQFQGSVVQQAVLDEIFVAYQAVFNAASSFPCINGVVGATVNPGASNLGSPFTIGLFNNGNPFTGQISEVRFDAAAWSTGDCQNEYANQKAFWFNRTAHEGFVASRCRIRTGGDSTNGFAMARSAHIASENLTAIRIAYDNPTNVGTSSITQSIEYPAGTFTQVLWGGTTPHTIPGLDQVISDYAIVAGGIPAGATFWIRTFWTNTGNNSFYNTWQNTFLGEATQLSATSISDLTMSGTVTNSGAFSMPPLAIIGVTANPSVLILGDSIAAGIGDTEDSSNSATGFNGKVGYIARSLGNVPFVNRSQSGAQASGIPGKAIWGFGSQMITEYGVNDIMVLGGQTSAQLITRLHAILDLRRPGQKAYQTTITDYTTSTDAWATVVNQTLQSVPQDAQRVTFNSALRAGTTGLTTLTNFIDTASISESSLNSGKWVASPTPPYTNDGLHPDAAGHNLLIVAAVVSAPAWP